MIDTNGNVDPDLSGWTVEYAVKTGDGKIRLIILDNLPEAELDKVDALPEEGFARLPILEKLLKKYKFGDEKDYQDGGMFKEEIPGVYCRCCDEASIFHEEAEE